MKRQLLACLAILFAISPASAQELASQSNRSHFKAYKDFKLRGDAKADHKKFRRKGEYFGALYINRPEWTSGAYSNAHSLFIADLYAKSLCEARSKNPRFCVLFAHKVPRNYQPETSQISLSRDANKEFREYLKLQNRERFGAFAVSENGAIGYSWAEATRPAASEEALQKCAKSARKVLRASDAEIRSIMMAHPSFQTCRLIHQSK